MDAATSGARLDYLISSHLAKVSVEGRHQGLGVRVAAEQFRAALEARPPARSTPCVTAHRKNRSIAISSNKPENNFSELSEGLSVRQLAI
jgi:hypothetical protein